MSSKKMPYIVEAIAGPGLSAATVTCGHRDRRRLRARRARSDRQEPQCDRESVSLHAYLQQSVVNRHYTARNANGGRFP